MLKKFLIGTFVALVMLVGVTASAADFGSTTLKVGSKGEAVKAVQTLVGATVDGSFGPMTAAKVKAWQATNGLEADGLFGSASKAKANATSSTPGCPAGAAFNSITGGSCTATVSTVPGCAVGAAFSATTGASCTSTVVTNLPAGCSTTAGFSPTTGASCSTGYTTPVNAEGYMTLQSAPVALTTAVGQSDTQDAIAAFAVKANDSDINVQRVSINIVPSTSALPWKYFTGFSLYQDNTLLGTVSATALTENSFGLDYTAIFSGFNAKVARNSTGNFIVKADIVGTIPAGGVTFNVGLKNGDSNAVRGVDGIGLTQYAGATSTAYTSLVQFTGTSSGVVKVVSNGSNPLAMNVVTSTTTTTTGLTALVFDLQNTSKYSETIKSITATASGAAGIDLTKVSGYYLYDGSTIISSLGNPGATGTLSFINLPSNFTIAANSTKTLTIKFDAAMNAAGAVKVDIATGGVVAVDANSNLIGSTGAATGNTQTLASTGVVVNLVSATAVAVPSTQGVSGYTTGTFVFKVKANGVNLAKLSTTSFLTVVGNNITNSGTAPALTATNYTYTVSPDTTVSDGSEVTVTLSATKTTASAGYSGQFTVTGMYFMLNDGTLPMSATSAWTTPASPNYASVSTGFDNFYTSSVWAN